MAMTSVQKRRKVRQEELREWLSKQKIAENILRRIDKMGDVSVENIDGGGGDNVADLGIARLQLDKLKAQNADALRLLNKYLPDERYLEIAGDPDRPMTITSTTFVGVSDVCDSNNDAND